MQIQIPGECAFMMRNIDKQVIKMSRNEHKKETFEDKFARKYYCNSYRFNKKVKKQNNKKFRRINKSKIKEE